VRISLIGRVTVELDGVVIDESQLLGRQGRLFFAYLVAEHSRPVPRDELAEALWGETPPETWEKALTVLASKLRRLLARHGVADPSLLTAAFGCYRLELPEGTWVDILEAANATDDAARALGDGDLDRARERAPLLHPLCCSDCSSPVRTAPGSRRSGATSPTFARRLSRPSPTRTSVPATHRQRSAPPSS
jgi:DNA-binding SARP family transcriptional activator